MDGFSSHFPIVALAGIFSLQESSDCLGVLWINEAFLPWILAGRREVFVCLALLLAPDALPGPWSPQHQP